MTDTAKTLIPEAAAYAEQRNAEKAARLAARRAGAPAALTDMITIERAERAARDLFPGDYSDGVDCQLAQGWKDEPCPICAERWTAWRLRVSQVHDALLKAFA